MKAPDPTLVTAADPDAAESVASSLSQGGIPARTVSPVPGRAGLASAIAEATRVVHVVTPAERRAAPLVDASPRMWDTECEALVRDALSVLQAAHDAFAGRGGHIVFLVPNVGISGCAGLVPYTTAVESIRALVKSAGRQWGERGIVPTTLVVPLGVLWPDVPELVRLPPPASARVPALDDVIAALRFLLDAPPAATGTTLVADGGSVMAP